MQNLVENKRNYEILCGMVKSSEWYSMLVYLKDSFKF